MKLGDNDPLWEQHSGRSGHRGQEWGPADGARAAEFYEALPEKARTIYDLLMDHPGERLDAGHIFAQVSPQGVEHWNRVQRSRSVSGSLAVTRRLATDAGRRFPFYWWKAKNGSATVYAMKPLVARLFREARQHGNRQR